MLEPWEAATLAAIIASPSAFDPKIYPENALGRRNLVLEKMYEQGYITATAVRGRDQAGAARAAPTSSRRRWNPRRPTSPPGCASSWSNATAPAKAFFGGLKVKSTLNLRLQEAAEEAVSSYLGGLPPTASVVVLDNHNGGVKAMVGGPNFETKPFNLAT